MADLSRTVKILFEAEDRLSANIAAMDSKLSKFGSGIETLANPLASVADSILKVDTALATIAGAGLVYAYSKSKDFESATVSLSKILGDEIGKIDSVKSAVLEMSSNYGMAATSVMDATTDFKRAGFAVEDALKLTENSIGLVIGAAEAEYGVAESTETIISVLKGFKAPAEDAARLTDILNAVANQYATSVSALGVGMARISPIAAKMGFSMEETAGMLTPVIEVFRSGEEASTALKTGLLKLIDDTKPVEEGLKRLGVAQKDANGNLRSGRDILVDVAKAFVHADKDSKLFLTSQLVGLEQSAKMAEVFDGLSKMVEITGVAMNSAGSISKEVAAKFATSQIAVDRFKVGFENLAIAVGDQFRVAATEAIDGGREIENALEKMVRDGTFKPVFDRLEDFADDVGDFLSEVAEALPEAMENVDWDGFLDSFGILREAISSFFSGVDLTDPEGLANAIQFAVDSIGSLINTTAGMAEAFEPVLDGIVSMIKGFNKMDTETQKEAGNILGAAKVIVDAGVLIAGAIIAVGEHADEIKFVFETTINAITGTFNTIKTVWYAAEDIVINLVDDMLAASELFDKIFLFGKFSGDIENARKALNLWSADVKQEMKASADAAIEDLTGLKTNFAGLGETIKELPAEASVTTSMDWAEEQSPEEYLKELTDALAKSGVLVKEKPVKIPVNAETEQAEKAIEMLVVGYTEDGKPLTIPVKAETEAAKKDVEEVVDAIPTEKQLEIKLQGEIDKELARIKSAADLVQATVEWQAKLDIAEAEAAAKIMEAAFSSIDTGITSTGELLGGLFEQMSGADSQLDKWNIEKQIEKENELRKKAFELQEKLTESQIEYNKAKTERMKDGESMVTVQAEGITPALEMIFQEVLKMCQMSANAEGLDLLLGAA